MITSLELAEEVAKYYDDPLGFVLLAWPWGEKHTRLEKFSGPDEIQTELLTEIGRMVRERGFDGATAVMPILMARASGHGTGKSTLLAMVAWWILSTRPHSMGTVTAGSYAQLEARSWAAVQTWGYDCITRDGFEIQAGGVYSKQFPSSWNVVPRSCKEENAQSFAGQHAHNSTSWYWFDEASEVPNKVYETAYGGLTDGEPMMFCFGQMIRSSGEFYEITFGSKSAKWNAGYIDSRKSSFTNKELIEQSIKEYGENSDFVRVRIMGLPPNASEFQFIPQSLVREARKREHQPLDDEPLIVGMDAANGGLAWWTFWFRCGLDAKSIKPIRLPGDTPREVVISKAAEIMTGRHGPKQKQVSVMFGDQAFGAVVIERLRALGHTNVFDINFGSTEVPTERHLNMRAYMWDQMREWLRIGALVDEEKYEQQLIAPGGGPNIRGKLVLESKADMAKRGVASPDDADGLALTFARRVAPPRKQAAPAPPEGRGFSWG